MESLLKLRLMLFFMLLLHGRAFSQQAPDSLESKFRWYQSQAFTTLAAPTLLMGYGVSTMGDNGLWLSSREAQQDLQRLFADFHTHADDFLAFSPALSVYALDLAGAEGKHDLFDRTAIYLISYGTMITAVTGLKIATRIERPDKSTFNSFPSAHTATAFAAAEFMHQELKDKSVWYSITGYTLATATGALRMLNDRHWLSDVFVGAGIGLLSTKVTYLLYPRLQERVGRIRSRNVSVLPSFYGGGAGVVIVYLIR